MRPILHPTGRPVARPTAVLLALLVLLAVASAASGSAPARERRPGTAKSADPRAVNGLAVQTLDTITPAQMAAKLVGSGVTISNVSYTGANAASGIFTGGLESIGIREGILLTTGAAANVVGPNQAADISQQNGLPGDPELDQLAGRSTYDASALQFDFVPVEGTIFFTFAFASDEYNEWVNTDYNDVFAFYVNGENCALVEGDPVAVNTINSGNPYGTKPDAHPDLYLNNDFHDGSALYDTEMDGFTDFLVCTARVKAGQKNTLRLVIADATDDRYDSAVFLMAESLSGTNLLELTGLEVNQAVQNLRNDVELVTGRPTIVRAHLRSKAAATVFGVSAQLAGRRNGQPLPGSPLTNINLGGTIDVTSAPNRGALSDSLNFRLPESWLSETVELELIVDTHAFDCLEDDGSATPSNCRVTVTFLPGIDPPVTLVPMFWQDANLNLYATTADDLNAVAGLIESTFPLVRLNWELRAPLPAGGDPPDVTIVLPLLEKFRKLDGSNRLYLGVLVNWVSGEYDGLAYVGKNAAVAYLYADTLAPPHEMAHILGRFHVNCNGREKNVDNGYPYAMGLISPTTTGPTAYFGLNPLMNRVFPPTAGDLLGYCRPYWVSDYTYEAMRRWTTAQRDSDRATLVAAGEPALLVSGRAGPQPSLGRLDPLLAVSAPAAEPMPTPGPYSIRFLNAAGAALAAYPFAPQTPSDGDVMSFALILPRPPGLARVELLRDGVVLDARVASANAPTVQITSPNGGESWNGSKATINWTAADADGDALTYTVQYRRAGNKPWQTLAVGLTSTSLSIDLSLMPGSTTARVRVLATDGLLTGEDTSNGVFTVAAKSPAVFITSPAEGDVVVFGQRILLSGDAVDAEDGPLVSDALWWESDVDGFLGGGGTLDLPASGLTPGAHTLTLYGQDSAATVGQASVTVTIAAEAPHLPPRLTVTPGELQFFAAPGSSNPPAQTLLLRNAGDGTVAWQASDNRPWLSLSQAAEYTPADVLVSVNVAGLRPGIYNGAITVTGDDAPGVTHRIPVELRVTGEWTYLPIAVRGGP